MPNARVGAMPLATHFTDEGVDRRRNEKKGRRGRGKGITIEDLKEQTAMRLAKEQRRRNAVSANRNSRNLRIAASDHSTHSCENSIESPSMHGHGRNAVGNGNTNGSSNAHVHVAAPVQVPVQAPASVPHTYETDPGNMPLNSSSSRGVSISGSGAFRHQLGPTDISNQQTHAPIVQHQHQQFQRHAPREDQASSMHTSRSQGFTGAIPNQDRQNHTTRKFVPHRDQPSNSTRHQQAASSNTNKLPHGLTVQELKEMTKARLAAEASEQSESVTSFDVSEGGGGDTFASGTAHNNHPRQRIYSHDSKNDIHRERQRLDSADSFGSGSAAFQQSSKYQQRGRLSAPQSRHMMAQPQDHHAPLSSFSYSNDAMDNASVNSLTSALGSESYFGSDTSGFYTATTANTRDLSRTRSYAIEENMSEEFERDYKTKSVSFESYTLSPTSLSHLFENRPLYPNDKAPATTPVKNKSVSMFGFANDESPASRASASTRIISNAANENVQWTDHGRGRPSSPRAVPTIDHNTDKKLNLMPTKLTREISRNGELPNSVAESVLGSSPPSSSENADVFHDYKSSMGLVCTDSTAVESEVKSYILPWSDRVEVKNNQHRSPVDRVSELNTNWNALLNIDCDDSAPDNFPLSTFSSKTNTTPRGSLFSPLFNSVPEEASAGLPNLSSRDVNVPEHFHDDVAGEVPNLKAANRKKSGQWRKKKN